MTFLLNDGSPITKHNELLRLQLKAFCKRRRSYKFFQQQCMDSFTLPRPCRSTIMFSEVRVRPSNHWLFSFSGAVLRAPLASIKVRFLRSAWYQEYSNFIFSCGRSVYRDHKIRSILQIIGARSRLLYVTGCMGPLMLDPPRRNSVRHRAEAAILCL